MTFNIDEEYNIQQAYDEVWEMNRIFGRFNKEPTKEQLTQQLALIKEELEETILAIQDNDKVATLDGAADLFVVLSGFMQMLEAKGFDVHGALSEVNENNASKVIFETHIMDKTLDVYNKLRINTYFDYDRISGGYVCKNELTNKVLKPYGFKSVTLDQFVPEGDI